MKLDPKGFYRTPLIMGPLFTGQKPRLAYPRVEVVALQYLTDPDAITVLLPSCYACGKEPQVTVIFGYNDGLDFMAGGGYRLATVQVSARFDGNRDHIEGDYILVMFEDQTWPILSGREDLGVPKLYADISPIKVYQDGSLRCEASLWGHLLFGLDLPSPRRQNSIVRIAANKIINSRPWLGYKYIPSLEGPPDVEYPTMTVNETSINELRLAKSGTMFFGNSDVRDIVQIKTLIDVLKTLRIVKVKQALHLQGSAILRFDLSRRLI